MYDDSFKQRYSYAPIAISETDTHIKTNPHIHNEIEVLCVMEGTSEIGIGRDTYQAKAGDVFFVNPMEIHSVIPDIDTSYRHKCFCFDTSLIVDSELGRKFLVGNVRITNHIKDEYVRNVFSNIYSVVENNQQTLLFDVSSEISRLMSYLINNSFLSEGITTTKESVFCRKVLEYIRNNYHKSISSKEISEELFYTQSHFCREFIKNFGTTFSNYLNMYRVHIAKGLLKQGDVKISDVAFECGFSSPEYFGRCFKSQIGMLPKEYSKSKKDDI